MKVEFDLLPMSVTTQPGVNSFMATVLVDNTVIGVTADVWTVSNNCNNSGPLLAQAICLDSF